jgi:MerR family Zn(II)-responsive transcriptional regulator of zntA
MERTYNIGEVAKLLRINRETVRYYEKVGLLDSPSKGENGYRLYIEEDLRKIRFIRVAKNYGFSLKEISTMFPKIYEDIHCEDKDSMLKILKNKMKEIDQRISELIDCRNLISKLSQNIETDDHTLCDGLRSLPQE